MTVVAYENPEDVDPTIDRRRARRTVQLSFTEVFVDDAGLDAALEAFAAAVREAARR